VISITELYTVLERTSAPPSAKKKTPSLAVRRLSYNAAVFQGKCKRYCILAYKFASYFSCYEIIAIFKALSYINETQATPLAQ